MTMEIFFCLVFILGVQNSTIPFYAACVCALFLLPSHTNVLRIFVYRHFSIIEILRPNTQHCLFGCVASGKANTKPISKVLFLRFYLGTMRKIFIALAECVAISTLPRLFSSSFNESGIVNFHILIELAYFY